MKITTRVLKDPAKGDNEFLAEIYTDGITEHVIRFVGRIKDSELFNLIKRIINERNEMIQRVEELESYIIRMEQEKTPHRLN